ARPGAGFAYLYRASEFTRRPGRGDLENALPCVASRNSYLTNARMPIEVKVPAVGESISSGVVSVWHKKSGEFVNAGDALFTLETDKVSTEIVAEKAGLLETLVPE